MEVFCSAVSKKSPLVTCEYLKCNVTSAKKERNLLFSFILINLSSQMFLVTTSSDSAV